MIIQKAQIQSPDEWASLGERFSLQQSEECFQAILSTFIRHNRSTCTIHNSYKEVVKHFIAISIIKIYKINCPITVFTHRLNLGNACCHSVQNLLSSHLLPSKIGKVHSLEYTDISKVFFMPDHVYYC
jgi:hypothetical protein